MAFVRRAVVESMSLDFFTREMSISSPVVGAATFVYRRSGNDVGAVGGGAWSSLGRLFNSSGAPKSALVAVVRAIVEGGSGGFSKRLLFVFPGASVAH